MVATAITARQTMRWFHPETDAGVLDGTFPADQRREIRPYLYAGMVCFQAFPCRSSSGALISSRGVMSIKSITIRHRFNGRAQLGVAIFLTAASRLVCSGFSSSNRCP